MSQIKARYDVLYKNGIKYTCFTTTKTRKEVVDILLDRFNDCDFTFKIKETINGVSEMVYSNLESKTLVYKPEKIVSCKMLIPVKDKETGKIYRSINALAKIIGIHQSALQRELQKGLSGYRYEIIK